MTSRLTLKEIQSKSAKKTRKLFLAKLYTDALLETINIGDKKTLTHIAAKYLYQSETYRVIEVWCEIGYRVCAGVTLLGEKGDLLEFYEGKEIKEFLYLCK